MIEAVEGVEAISLSMLASAASGARLRRKRLGWLAALHAAQGQASPEELSSLHADEQLQEETRERIAGAVRTAEQLRGISDGGASPVPTAEAGLLISVTELARRIGAAGERCLEIQARLGAVAVRDLVAPRSPIAMNRL